MKTNSEAKQEAIKAVNPPTGEVMTAEETEEANFWQKQSSMLKLEKQVAEFKARAEAAEEQFNQLKQFLYEEIIHRRDYSASKSFEVVLDKIAELERTKP